MLDDERTDNPATPESPETASGGDPAAKATKAPRKRAAKKTAAGSAPPPPDEAGAEAGTDAPARPARRTRKKATAASAPEVETAGGEPADSGASEPARPTRSRTRKTAAAAAAADPEPAAAATPERIGVPTVLFQPPEPEKAVRKRAPRKQTAKAAPAAPDEPGTVPANAGPVDLAQRLAALADADDDDTTSAVGDASDGGEDDADRPAAARRRRRGGRGRGRGGAGAGGDTAEAEGDEATKAAAGTADDDSAEGDDSAETDGPDGEGSAAGRKRRRRRRRRTGDGASDGSGGEDDDAVETVVHVREPRPAAKKTAASRGGGSRGGGGGGGGEADDEGVRGVKGSTRLEAKRQRRREGRDTGRRRAPIITESEFLARRESVERVMVVRQAEDRTQIGVLEDGILVEHYVARKDQTSMVGNVYLGKVQNVLPSMEAAFVDIGRGRNAVLYAGEVNYDASALEGRPPRIEQALKSGQSVLVQVTKDPIGHKGSRLTSQVSLPGRYMVYVPDGRLSGISRKLPDTERTRLKGILKRLTPEDAGVIIRTAAEGATEEELERDLKRLHAQWEDIAKKAQTASAPSLIYGEPDVVIRVIRDIFNEDFKELIVSGADEWETVDNYLRWVAPDLAERARKWTDDKDVFEAHRIDEQLAKALDRKVHLPSGGSLVIDKTEAMIVVDVNTGKFTGKGGNLEETVTKNNLEAAEEIVRQLRLRDIGGIIVIDFIDMVLESNRDLVLRRLLECLGRDRTRHQVAEVTSLGLVQMTRKRVGQGLLEAFSETCKECGGRGVILTLDPVASKRPSGGTPAKSAAANGGGSNRGSSNGGSSNGGSSNAGDAGEEPKKRRSRGGRGRGKGAADGSAAESDAPADSPAGAASA